METSRMLVNLHLSREKKFVWIENLFFKNVPYSHTQLTRILLACNRLIRNCSNWRCHEQYLLAMTCMSKCVSKDVLMSSYVPMIKEEVFNTVRKCRVLISRQLCKFLLMCFLESFAMQISSFNYFDSLDERSH